MNNNERLIQFFDLHLHSKTRAKGIGYKLPPTKSLCELIGDFKQLRELNKARQRAGGDFEICLEDIEERDDSWVLLFNVVDGKASHPVTQKIGGGDDDREIIELGTDRGIESSSHVVIYKSPDTAGKSLTLCEKSFSIPFSRIVRFLNYLSKEAARSFSDSYVKPHPNGAKDKTINTYCCFDYFGHPSNQFRDELETGRLSDIRITSDADIVRGYDANVHSELYSTEIRMKVGRLDVMASRGNWGHLQKAISHAESLNAPFVRVQFQDESGAGHTANISTDTGQLWNADKYVKKVKIQDFGNSLRTAYPIIHEGIRDKILELIG
jgi:hypothetical protein